MTTDATQFTIDALATGDVVCLVSDANTVEKVQKAVTAVITTYGCAYGIATQPASAGGAAVIQTSGRVSTSVHGLTGGPSKVRVSTLGRAEKVASYTTGDIPLGNLDANNVLFLLPAMAVAPAVVSGVGSVSGSGTTSSTGGASPVVSNAAADQLSANMRGAFVNLADANATLTLAGGRRYLIPAGTLTSTRRTLTLGTTGAVADDTITIDRRDSSAWPLQVVSGGAMLTMVNRRGLYRFRFDGTSWLYDDHSARMRVFNVIDYGARGDEFYSGGSTATERAAIQAAIDAAATWCRNLNGSGAVVDFGSGTYRVDGELIMRRTPRERPIIYRGDGAIISHQGGIATDLFRVESLSENGDLTHGGYGHVFEGLFLQGGARNLVWDLGSPSSYGFADGPRAQIHFYRCVFDGDAGGPLVRLVSSSRTRFIDCDVDPFYAKQGNTWVELLNGSASFYGCQGGGAFIRARESGEIYMYGCRPEGASLTPAIDLENCSGVVISGGSSEGHDEGDALIRAVGCTGLIIDQFTPANTDRSYIRLRGRLSLTLAAVSLTFANDDSYPTALPSVTRSSGSWFADGVCIGSVVKFTGTASNPGPFTVKELTHTKLIFTSAIVAEGPTTAGAVTATSTVYDAGLTLQPTLTFAANGGAGFGTITRSAGRWDEDGFLVGMKITRTNATNSKNKGALRGFGDYDLTITAISGNSLTLTVAQLLADEVKTNAVCEADKFAAGIKLSNCDYFDLRRILTAGSFRSDGDFSRYGVEIDANCRDGQVQLSGGGRVDLGEQDISLNASAYNVYAEYAGIASGGVPLTWYSTRKFGKLEPSEVQTPKLAAPTNTNLEIVGDAGDAIVLKIGSDPVAQLSYNTGATRIIQAHIHDTQINYTGFVSIEPSTFCSINVGTNFDVNATGLKFRVNSTGISFFAAGVVAQQADTVALTDSTGGTADNTLVDVGASHNQATLNNNFADLAAKYNALRTLLRNYGLMA